MGTSADHTLIPHFLVQAKEPGIPIAPVEVKENAKGLAKTRINNYNKALTRVNKQMALIQTERITMYGSKGKIPISVRMAKGI